MKNDAKMAGLSEREIELLNTPFQNLSLADRATAFSASDKLAEYNRSQPYTASSNALPVIMDKDKLLANGVLSPITKEAFHNRADYKDHLKRHGCVEIGNDFNNSDGKRPLQGDFDCRKELAQATHEVCDKYGIR